MTQLELLRSWSDARLLELIRQSQPWIDEYGLLAVAIGLFTETLMFTGFVVPGYGILIAAGFLVASGSLPPGATFVVAVVAAVAGDQVSFGAGRLAGVRLMRRKQSTVTKISDGLHRQGVVWLLWYHYVPPLRAALPCVAGYINYPYRRWLLFDTAGVAIWVGVAMTIGYTASGTLHDTSSLAAQFINGIIGILVIVFMWRIKRAFAAPVSSEQSSSKQ
jgi:membrane protein DedA with SNARE-associated domain